MIESSQQYITSNEFQDHRGNKIKYYSKDNTWFCVVNNVRTFSGEHLIDVMMEAIQSLS